MYEIEVWDVGMEFRDVSCVRIPILIRFQRILIENLSNPIRINPTFTEKDNLTD